MVRLKNCLIQRGVFADEECKDFAFSKNSVALVMPSKLFITEQLNGEASREEIECTTIIFMNGQRIMVKEDFNTIIEIIESSKD